MVLVNGFGVGIGGIRQRHRANRTIAQTQHSRLRTYPNVFLDVLEEVQYGIAWQLLRRGHLRKLLRTIGKQAMPNRPNPQGPIGGLSQEPNCAVHLGHALKSIGIVSRNQPMQPRNGTSPNGVVRSLD